MALVNCRECGASVFRYAKRCPSCGISHPGISIVEKIAYIICLGVFVGILLVFLNFGGTSKSAKSDSVPAAANLEPATNAKTDAVLFYQQVTNITNTCTVAGAVRTLAVLGGDPVQVYQSAQNEEANCHNVSEQLKALKVPLTFSREVANSYLESLKHCEATYENEAIAAYSLKAALDSNEGKIRNLAIYRYADTNSKAENSACSDGLLTAAIPLGVTHDELISGHVDGGEAPPPADQEISKKTHPLDIDDDAPTAQQMDDLNDFSFGDFPSIQYQGPILRPNFSAGQRAFRKYKTAISEGVKRGPVFAGSVALAATVCGPACGKPYAIDLKSGKVVEFPVGGETMLHLTLEFHRTSRLVKTAWSGSVVGDPTCAGYAYLEWTGEGFKTLARSTPLPDCHAEVETGETK